MSTTSTAEQPAKYLSYVVALVLVVATIGIYLPGLDNELLFDDVPLLKNRSLFHAYGSLLEFKQRMLSYGSFVWIEQWFGPGYWKQRLVNVILHLGSVAALYGLLKALLVQTRFSEDLETEDHFAASRIAAVQIGVALFALHPVAVYAVGYLVQRSILMATLFSLLACLAWVKALTTHRWFWFLLAPVCYGLAVLSKEHALMTVALAVPLYIYVRRPSWKTTVGVAIGAVAVLGIATGLLLHFYGDLVGSLFDAQSKAYAQQLETLQPGITERMYPLSVLNQAALFFGYGLRWVMPYLGWLSIDLRPAFPLSLASPWHMAGALAYLSLFAGSAWLLLRRTGAWSLAGLLMLFPLLWFFTEFSTVWVQDPFVLYRSYLWATVLPGLVAIALVGVKPRTIYAIGTIVCMVLCALTFERVLSLRSEVTAWTDAAEKTDFKAPPNSVGRSRPFVNLAAYYLPRNTLDLAERNLSIAKTFGDRGELGGMVLFNTGVLQQIRKQDAAALQSFSAAEAMGYSAYPLHYHRAESLVAVGQLPAAYRSIVTAIHLADTELAADKLLIMRIRKAEIAMAAQMYSEAISELKALLTKLPDDPRLVLGLGMAYLGNKEVPAALQLFEKLIAERPSAAAYYGRALAYHQANLPDASLRDLDQALKLQPNNQQYLRMRETVMASKK